MDYSADANISRRNKRFPALNKLNIFAAGKLRLAGFAFLMMLFGSATHLSAATFTVTSTADNESNGCAVGVCTLREAINAANANPDADTIEFSPAVTGTIILTQGQLIISRDLTINGPGARNLTISGNNASRVFLIATPLLAPAFTANISGLTITRGNSLPLLINGTLIGDGGGILNGALLGVLGGVSTLNLSDSVVTDNATTTLGGGIATRIGANTNITRCLISNNTANPAVALLDGSVGGGGVSNLALSTTTITNSTITGNNSLALGGGILNVLGTTNLTNDTISHNTSTLAGGGVASILSTGLTNMRNTIIAKNNDLLGLNVVGRDVFGVLGAFNSLGGNLIGSNFGAETNFTASVFVGISPQPNVNLDLVGGIDIGNQVIDPRLSALANNGGPTNTRALLAGSAAINTGQSCVINLSCISGNPPEALTTDQRGPGFPRLQETFVDIGAFESNVAPAATVFVVTTTADNESDGCGVGQCTLREAINEANALPGADIINFAPGVTGTITLTTGQLIITSDVTINGPGDTLLAVNGNNTSRVFLVATPFSGGDFTATINRITITGGNATPVLLGSTLIGDGGGVLNGGLLGLLNGTSTLILRDVSVVNNSSTTLGGGVATRLGAVTNIYRSLIANNVSNPVIPIADGTVGGGGISNAALSTTTILNSTVTNNQSLALGGGILNVLGTVNSTNNTISHNTSTLAGGGVASLLGVVPPVLGVTNLLNTIVAKNNDLLATNIIGRDVVGVLGSIKSLGNNVIGSNFGAEVNLTASVVVGGVAQPNVNLDIIGGIDVGNTIVDPLLGPLADNGGSTLSRAITPVSPAHNRGHNCVITNTCTGMTLPFALTTDDRGAGFSRISGMAVDIGSYEYQLGPTAAAASISGKVFDTRGKAMSKVTITIRDSAGQSRTVTTTAFGGYSFTDLPAGTTYVIQASAKGYQFAPQIVNLSDDITGLNFTAIVPGNRD